MATMEASCALQMATMIKGGSQRSMQPAGAHSQGRVWLASCIGPGPQPSCKTGRVWLPARALLCTRTLHCRCKKLPRACTPLSAARPLTRLSRRLSLTSFVAPPPPSVRPSVVREILPQFRRRSSSLATDPPPLLPLLLHHSLFFTPSPFLLRHSHFFSAAGLPPSRCSPQPNSELQGQDGIPVPSAQPNTPRVTGPNAAAEIKRWGLRGGSHITTSFPNKNIRKLEPNPKHTQT